MSVFLSSSHECAVKENNLKQTSVMNWNTCWSRTCQIPQILYLKGVSVLIFLSVIPEFLELVQDTQMKYRWPSSYRRTLFLLFFFHLFSSRLNIPKETLIPLTKQDQMKLDSILKRPYVTCQPFWRKEVCFLLKFKCCMFYCLLF